ncbi:MAG: flavodoxin family protein [Chloroflexota bacterium]
MKVLVVYDSLYGNTEEIARAIGGGFTGEVKVLRVGEVNPSEIKAVDLFIVGSPTQAGRASPGMRDFLNKIPGSSLEGINVAAFDTRVPTKIVKVFGYAAGRIAGNLEGKGGTLVVPPEGFFVKGTKGPLKEGELERAAVWAKGIAGSQRT